MKRKTHEPRLIGLIAGAGSMPAEVVRFANQAGFELAVVALLGMADESLASQSTHSIEVGIGELEKTVAFFHKLGVQEIMLAGKVDKSLLLASDTSYDKSASGLLGQLKHKNDDAILLAVVDLLQASGLKVLDSTHFLSMILPEKGCLTKTTLDAGMESDITFGYRMAKAIGDLDIGQTVVVKNGIVLAVEAIEGTDKAILRGGELAKDGAVVVKVSKPKQDARFDMPTVGPGTIQSCIDAKVSVLAFESGATVLLNREEVLRLAIANGIHIVSI